jgi:hypothetical protein
MSCYEQFRTFLDKHTAENNSAFETVADMYDKEEVALAAQESQDCVRCLSQENKHLTQA